MNDLTLVIPAKQESESLPYVLKELKKFDLNIKIVLEKNDIHTINSIKSFNCDILFQKENGYGGALIEGISSVNTKYFSIFNADGSFVPDELPKMYELIKSDKYDLIFGSRYIKKKSSEDDTLITLVGNFFFSKLGKFFFKLPITDILYTFVLGKTDQVKSINFRNKDFRFCVELPIKSQRKNLRLFDFPSYERRRYAGKKKVNAFRDGYFILKEMIRLFFHKN